MKHLVKIFSLSALLLGTQACDKTEVTPEADYSLLLSNVGTSVIVPTYAELAQFAADMEAKAQTFLNNPTDANLDSLRQSWVRTRAPWEKSEGFLFGPVDQEGLDPSLDSWPVNVTDLDNVLNSGQALTVAFLQQQEGTLKGFHTLEYLMWGVNGQKQAADFTAREKEYLAACAGTLKLDTKSLSDLWDPTSGNFIHNLVQAGQTGSIYLSQKAALEELGNAIVTIADEVANGKINDPYAQQDLSLEESRFSANSKADFADNIRSIKNIYTGYYGSLGTGIGLGQRIAESHPDLHSQILSEIDAAIAAIENIPGTFSDAVMNNRQAVADAQQAVRTLQATLEEELLPILSN